MEGKYSFDSPEWEDIGEGPKDLIRKLLIVEPKRRLTADEALSHPWFECMLPCPRCCMTSTYKSYTPQRKKIKLKISLRTLAYAILTLRKLYNDFHQQYVPMTYRAVCILFFGPTDFGGWSHRITVVSPLVS